MQILSSQFKAGVYWLVLLFALVTLTSFLAQASEPQLDLEGVTTPGEAPVPSYTFPKGSVFLSLNQTPLHTNLSKPGDQVMARMVHPIYLGNYQVLNGSTIFMGKVRQSQGPIKGRHGILAVVFDEVRLNDGRRFKLDAHVKTPNKNNTWGGGLTPGTKPLVIQNRVTGIGQYNRIIAGGPREMGRHLQSLPGETWQIVLDEPWRLPLY